MTRQKPPEFLLAAERKSDRALALIKTVRASTTTTFDF
jgi:hypothetical protein